MNLEKNSERGRGGEDHSTSRRASVRSSAVTLLQSISTRETLETKSSYADARKTKSHETQGKRKEDEYRCERWKNLSRFVSNLNWYGGNGERFVMKGRGGCQLTTDAKEKRRKLYCGKIK